LLFLSSCVSINQPNPNISKINKNPKNWVKIYEHELQSARENNDLDAWRFFWPEYLKERYKQRNK